MRIYVFLWKGKELAISIMPYFFMNLFLWDQPVRKMHRADEAQ